VEITQDIIEESEDERFDDMNDTVPPIELPLCEISRLEEINEVSTVIFFPQLQYSLEWVHIFMKYLYNKE